MKTISEGENDPAILLLAAENEVSPYGVPALYVFSASAFLVAQTSSLPYRRIVFCRSPASSGVLEGANGLRITNRRYGTLEVRATLNTRDPKIPSQ